jgi:uncharacterized membrane protein
MSVFIGFAIKGIFLSKHFLQQVIKEKDKKESVLNYHVFPEEASVEIENEEIKVESEVVAAPILEAQLPYTREEPITEQTEYSPAPPSALASYITNFFKTNLLAKIGAILIFLGVVFLLSLVWDKIPSFGKI